MRKIGQQDSQLQGNDKRELTLWHHLLINACNTSGYKHNHISVQIQITDPRPAGRKRNHTAAAVAAAVGNRQ